MGARPTPADSMRRNPCSCGTPLAMGGNPWASPPSLAQAPERGRHTSITECRPHSGALIPRGRAAPHRFAPVARGVPPLTGLRMPTPTPTFLPTPQWNGRGEFQFQLVVSARRLATEYRRPQITLTCTQPIPDQPKTSPIAARVRKNVNHRSCQEQKGARNEEAQGRLPVEPRRGSRGGRFEGGGSLDSAEAENNCKQVLHRAASAKVHSCGTEGSSSWSSDARRCRSSVRAR